METIINSSYLITVGTLIGFERKMKCKELAGMKEKEAYKQIPFCEGICCVQTYRNIEKATLEVKTPIYVALLHNLGYEMHYDDALYKEINYRLQNLNDAIEKYDLESVFLIVEKLNKMIPKHNDIYYKYLLKIVDVIYHYYKSNEFPDIDDVEMMKLSYNGFPVYFKDIIIDLLFKYGMLNIIHDEEFKRFVLEIDLHKSKFIPNQINNLLYYCYIQDYDKFYKNIDYVINQLNRKEIFIRIIDIYDLKITADLNVNPTKIDTDIILCENNVKDLISKLKINSTESDLSRIPKMVRRKLSQHFYHLGYVLMMINKYNEASKSFEKSIFYDDVFEVLCKVSLFSCYDHLNKSESDYGCYINLKGKYDDSNKHYVLFKYYQYKFKEKDSRKRLKYLKKHVIDSILVEDSVLIKILFYEVNKLAKETSNYQILQEFIEKKEIIS